MSATEQPPITSQPTLVNTHTGSPGTGSHPGTRCRNVLFKRRHTHQRDKRQSRMAEKQPSYSPPCAGNQSVCACQDQCGPVMCQQECYSVRERTCTMGSRDLRQAGQQQLCEPDTSTASISKLLQTQHEQTSEHAKAAGDSPAGVCVCGSTWFESSSIYLVKQPILLPKLVRDYLFVTFSTPSSCFTFSALEKLLREGEKAVTDRATHIMAK